MTRPKGTRLTSRLRASPLTPLLLLLLLFAWRGVGCRKKGASAVPEVTPAAKHGWITPLLTAPPPQATPTLWRSDITRVPTLPE